MTITATDGGVMKAYRHKRLWYLRLSYWLWRYGYSSVRHVWKTANQECWEDYRKDGETPKSAVMTDLSYL